MNTENFKVEKPSVNRGKKPPAREPKFPLEWYWGVQEIPQLLVKKSLRVYKCTQTKVENTSEMKYEEYGRSV